jgi:hypothetical protein
MPHRPLAEHVIHQMPRTLGHAPCAATRADAALLVGKRYQALGMAVLARHAQETVVEHAAELVAIELLAHVFGQHAVFRRKPSEEVRVVRLHQRVQKRALGSVVGVARHCRCGRRGAK